MAWNIQGLPSDLLTDDIEGVRRLAVDQQQTSFEKNFQFGFFDQFINVPESLMAQALPLSQCKASAVLM